ncbi:carbamoyl phosphate synthase small subunit, partial [Campylobacter sp. CH185]
MKAYIYLENDIFLSAKAFGKSGTFFGELVFNTSLTGYQEIISDPSYAGQFIVFSMPEIGIVGTNENDNESKEIFASGVLMRELSSSFSNFRAKESLQDYLEKHGKIGIYELDTRYLV